MSESPRHFVILLGPNGPRPMTADEHGQFLALWHTAQEAREAVKDHMAVRAFGAEIFELGSSDEVIV